MRKHTPLLFPAVAFLLSSETMGGLQIQKNDDLFLLSEDGDLITENVVTENGTPTSGLLVTFQEQGKLESNSGDVTIDGTVVEKNSLAGAEPKRALFIRRDQNGTEVSKAAINQNGDFLLTGKKIEPDIGTKPSYIRTLRYTQGRVSEGKTTFFNSFGDVIQEQTRINSVKAVVKGSEYNNLGLPTKKTLSAPLYSCNTYIPNVPSLGLQVDAYYKKQFGENIGATYVERKYSNSPTRELIAEGARGDLSLGGTKYASHWEFGIKSSSGFFTRSALTSGTFKTNADATDAEYLLKVSINFEGDFKQEIFNRDGQKVREWVYTGNVELVTQYEYDPRGNLIRVIPPLGTDYAVVYRYNMKGERIEEISPDNGTTKYEYLESGKVKRVIRNGVATEYQYDDHDRVISVVVESRVVETIIYSKDEALTWISTGFPDIPVDVIAKLQEAPTFRTEPLVQIAYNNSPVANEAVIKLLIGSLGNREKTEYLHIPTVGWSKRHYSFDVGGVLQSIEIFPAYQDQKWPEPIVFNYANTLEGKFESLSDKNKKKIFSIKHDELGKTVGYSYYTRSGEELFDTQKESDFYNRMAKIASGSFFSEQLQYNNSASYDISSAKFDYKLGHVSKTLEHTYSYDKLSRLTSVTSNNETSKYTEAFQYDGNSRMLNKAKGVATVVDPATADYAYYPKSHRLKSVNSLHGATDNYVYDVHGNIIEDKSKRLKIVYDWQNRPVKVTFTDNAGNWVSDLEMVYGPDGNRVLKRVKTLEKISTTAYDDQWIVYTGEGATPNYRVETVNIITPAGTIGTLNYESGERRYALKDHLGSVRAVVSDNGELVNASAYDAYGQQYLIATNGDTEKQRMLYTGKEFDTEGGDPSANINGLDAYYFGSRYYNPLIGIWYSTDPAKQYANSYSFLNGDAIGSVDLDGNWALKHILVDGTWNNPLDYLYYYNVDIKYRNDKYKNSSIAWEKERWKITHDAHGYTTLDDLNDYLATVDWDAALISDRERESWENHFKLDLKGYQLGNIHQAYSPIERLMKDKSAKALEDYQDYQDMAWFGIFPTDFTDEPWYTEVGNFFVASLKGSLLLPVLHIDYLIGLGAMILEKKLENYDPDVLEKYFEEKYSDVGQNFNSNFPNNGAKTGIIPGSVICTEMHRQGFFNDTIMKADIEFGRKMRREDTFVYYGYLAWAPKLVKVMQRNDVIGRLISRIVSFFAVPWAKQMAYEMGYIKKGTMLGTLIMNGGIPICRFIGETLSNERINTLKARYSLDVIASTTRRKEP